MESIMSIGEIKAILPHRHPFLFVDRVVELEPGKRAVGLKNLTLSESFFQGHFPENPIMPGVLQIEAISQLAAICGLTSYNEEERPAHCVLASIEKVKFRQSVVPGDQLILRCSILKHKGNFWWFAGVTEVDGKRCLEATISAKLF